ncbi:caspase family protein [Verticiella alkaliphila]|uniref:caspase family protein n=1 Tax=Verticiella alkaliphila TaxID=2779529 RepID=UPI001C0C20F7|nr:caspase family protein [Verticiella sp. GG226]
MRRRIRRAFVVLVVAVSAAWQPAQAADSPLGRRVAVLIGVTEYGPGDNLANPGRDATRMGETLARLGYDVRVLVNPTQAKVESTVATLESQVKAESVPLESLLFFFSGHGGQRNGVSQLILGDADAEGEYRTLDLAALSTRLGALKAAATVFVLDACREDDAELIRGGKTGLAPPPRATGAFFAYAAAPGDLAYDDAGWEDRELSPFTYALIDELLVPGQDIGIIMRKVRDRVSRDTQGEQIPWTEDALTGPLVLNAAPVTPALFDLYGKALKGDALAARDLGYAYLYGEGVDTTWSAGWSCCASLPGWGIRRRCWRWAPSRPSAIAMPCSLGMPRVTGI